MDSVTHQPTVAPKDRKDILRKALQTECDLEMVTVAVDKVTMEVSVPLPIRVIQLLSISGRSRISGKGVHMDKGVADFISFFLNIP